MNTIKEFDLLASSLGLDGEQMDELRQFMREYGELEYERGLNTKVVGSTKVKSKTTHDRGGGLADLI